MIVSAFNSLFSPSERLDLPPTSLYRRPPGGQSHDSTLAWACQDAHQAVNQRPRLIRLLRAECRMVSASPLACPGLSCAAESCRGRSQIRRAFRDVTLPGPPQSPCPLNLSDSARHNAAMRASTPGCAECCEESGELCRERSFADSRAIHHAKSTSPSAFGRGKRSARGEAARRTPREVRGYPRAELPAALRTLARSEHPVRARLRSRLCSRQDA
jgi:hypothetical protein